MRKRLDALETKIDAHKSDPATEKAAKNERSQFGMAIRVSSDFIAAIFVGGALGWFLDSFAGTSPFGMIILLLLGFAAGVLNVMRTLGMVAMPRGMKGGMSTDVSKDAAKGLPREGASGIASRRDDTENSGREGG